MTQLKVKSPEEPIDHPVSESWLHETAKMLVTNTVMPHASADPVFSLHRSFLHNAFLYVDRREAIQWDNGPQVVPHWKYWLVRFLACGCTNYAKEFIYPI